LFLLPGFLVLLLGSEFVQVAGLRGEPLNLPSALFIGTMMLIYLALVVLPALAVLVLGLADWRAQPRLMGGQVLAVRHLPGRTSQGHYILLETPDGRRVRLRLDPLWHNQCCHVGARVALSVSPRLRHVSKVWSEAGEPPVLV
jgi:hypothetical protein